MNLVFGIEAENRIHLELSKYSKKSKNIYEDIYGFGTSVNFSFKNLIEPVVMQKITSWIYKNFEVNGTER